MPGRVITRLYTNLLRLWGWFPIPRRLRWDAMWLINQKFLVGVAAIVLNERGEVLLFKHTYRDTTPWGLPGGWLQGKEEPARAVEREIMEESGMQVCIEDRPVWVGGDKHLPRVDIVFLGRYVSGDFRPCAEVCEVRFFGLDELPKLIPGTKELIARVVGEGLQQGL